MYVSVSFLQINVFCVDNFSGRARDAAVPAPVRGERGGRSQAGGPSLRPLHHGRLRYVQLQVDGV